MTYRKYKFEYNGQTIYVSKVNNIDFADIKLHNAYKFALKGSIVINQSNSEIFHLEKNTELIPSEKYINISDEKYSEAIVPRHLAH